MGDSDAETALVCQAGRRFLQRYGIDTLAHEEADGVWY